MATVNHTQIKDLGPSIIVREYLRCPDLAERLTSCDRARKDGPGLNPGFVIHKLCDLRGVPCLAGPQFSH